LAFPDISGVRRGRPDGFRHTPTDILNSLSNTDLSRVARDGFCSGQKRQEVTMSTKQGTELATAVSALIGVVLLIAVVYVLTAGRFATQGAPGTPEEIAARTRPVGTVTLVGSEGAAPPAAAPAVAASAGGEGPGAEVYNKACFACHATGAAGAPKLGDKTAWEPRVALGIDQLLQTAINGKGAMPPRGTCATCSDEDLRAAIQYMLAQTGFETATPTAEAAVPAAESTVSPPQSAAPPAGVSAPAAEGTPGMSGTSGISATGGMSGDTAAPAAGTAMERPADPAAQ
jgi:cytochrome c5